jgi:hypothetical protein
LDLRGFLTRGWVARKTLELNPFLPPRIYLKDCDKWGLRIQTSHATTSFWESGVYLIAYYYYILRSEVPNMMELLMSLFLDKRPPSLLKHP